MFENIDGEVDRIKRLLSFLIEKHGFSPPKTRDESYGKFLYYFKGRIGICAEYDFRDEFFGLKIAQLRSPGKLPDGNRVAAYPTTIVVEGLNLRDLGLAYAVGEDEIEKTINRDVYLIEKYMPTVFEGSDEVFERMRTQG